jgi:hypothetical protein
MHYSGRLLMTWNRNAFFNFLEANLTERHISSSLANLWIWPIPALTTKRIAAHPLRMPG